MRAPVRIMRTVDGDLVHGDDPAAAFLVAGEGCEIPAQYREAAEEFLTAPTDTDGTDTDGTDTDGTDTDGTEPEAPAGNAGTEAWQAYALALGASADDIDGLGRDELRERYGPK